MGKTATIRERKRQGARSTYPHEKEPDQEQGAEKSDERRERGETCKKKTWVPRGIRVTERAKRYQKGMHEGKCAERKYATYTVACVEEEGGAKDRKRGEIK